MKSCLKRPIEISAKTGLNVEALLKELVREIPPPTPPKIEFNGPSLRLSPRIAKHREKIFKNQENSPAFRAYIFDSWFEENQGLFFVAKMANGSLRAGDVVQLSNDPTNLVEVKEVGVFAPNKESRPVLPEGSVGWVSTNLKDPKIGIEALGETLSSLHPMLEPLTKPEKSRPIVFASLFPNFPDEYDDFVKAVDRIALEDPAIVTEPESSNALGNGLRCGFLGELHLDVFRQRLRDDYNVETICTPPSVTYLVKIRGKEDLIIRHPSEIAGKLNNAFEFFERYAKVIIITRKEDAQPIYSLIENRRGKVTENTQISQNQSRIVGEIPLSEIIEDFNNELKVMTKGYGSFDFELLDYRSSEIQVLKITVMDEEVDAFQFLVHKSKAAEMGKRICQAFKDHLSPQLFTVTIRASLGSRIIAKEEIKAMRKDVTAKCYGGDYSRKKKLLDRQKEGKLRMREFGKVKISSSSINKIFKAFIK